MCEGVEKGRLIERNSSLFQQSLINVAAAQVEALCRFPHGFFLRHAFCHKLPYKLLGRFLRHAFLHLVARTCDDEDEFAARLFLAVVRQKFYERAATEFFVALRQFARGSCGALAAFRWCGAS